MNIEVGDYVKLREGLEFGIQYEGQTFVEIMAFEGYKEVVRLAPFGNHIISGMKNDRNGYEYCYTPEMIGGVLERASYKLHNYLAQENLRFGAERLLQKVIKNIGGTMNTRTLQINEFVAKLYTDINDMEVVTRYYNEINELSYILLKNSPYAIEELLAMAKAKEKAENE